MIGAMLRVMVLQLWRDRGALVMAFVLPSLVFLIFSAVFAGATGEDVKLKLAFADVADTANSKRLAGALLVDKAFRAVRVKPQTEAEVRREVKSGEADVGLVIRGDPVSHGAQIAILSDPTRAVAAPLAEARTQEALTRALPDVLLARTLHELEPAIGALTPDQSANAAIAEDSLRGPSAAAPSTSLFVHEDIAGAKRGGGTIAYYAGAVTILFALFSAMNGALTLLDERRSGIADRILVGRAGMGPVVSGKFLFLVGLVMAQAGAIFATAAVIYGVPVAQHFGLWLATTALAAVCAAGLALGVVSLCRTREQAQILSTFTILVLAAVGGSMVPRFLMPPWLQQLGWATPHAWVIDAYQQVLWRDAGPEALYKAWAVLALIGLAGLAIAHALARLSRR